MSTPPTEQTGSLDTALANAARLLETDPRLAAAQAAEILKALPGQPLGTLLLGRAQRDCGDTAPAIATLQALCAEHPQWGLAHQELGLALGAAGRGAEAIATLRRAVRLKPELGDAWRALADHLHAVDDVAGADDAYAHYLRASSKDPRLMQAAAALCDKRIAVAETLLRSFLKEAPTDVAAIRMLAEVAGRLGRYGDAEKLLVRCLELAPGFVPARYNYALVLHRRNKLAEARRQIEQLLAANAEHGGHNNLYAAILSRLGEYARAIEVYEKVLRQYRGLPKVWLSYGHTLKTAGRQEDSIAAYREALRLAPALGEAWWSLANLKTFRFTAEEIATMQTGLERTSLSDEDRYHLHFALAKALEDLGRDEQAFRHYAEGNRLRRAGIRYDPTQMTEHVRRSRALFTPDFFAARAGFGTPEPDPIFIVGLPRAGSTLLEQILASHSAIEGTMELPDMLGIARKLGGRKSKSGRSLYPDVLATLTAEDCRALGQQYLGQTAIQRKTGRRFFIDKMPNNFAHVGLIQLALPNAKIIDARRHPLACCFSVFKQHFALGQNFSYSLEDIGRYYRDYVELMAHFDAVLPGRVHRVFHERLIDDTEGEIRRLLQFCNVPFEESCLRFFENDRAVRTASSEQVRRPINREGVDQWRRFEAWLDPLRNALGPVLDAYPETPPF
jgi:tetratricopeptide (TPR) repeat protein